MQLTLSSAIRGQLQIPLSVSSYLQLINGDDEEENSISCSEFSLESVLSRRAAPWCESVATFFAEIWAVKQSAATLWTSLAKPISDSFSGVTFSMLWQLIRSQFAYLWSFALNVFATLLDWIRLAWSLSLSIYNTWIMKNERKKRRGWNFYTHFMWWSPKIQEIITR